MQANLGAFNQLLILILKPPLATAIAGYDLLILRVTRPHICPCLQLFVVFFFHVHLMSSSFPKSKGILNFTLRFNSVWDVSALGSWPMFRAKIIALSAVYE